MQGCGPVGLMAVQAARTFKPSVIYAVDTVAQRLEMAQGFGAVPVDASAVHVAEPHPGPHRGPRRRRRCSSASVPSRLSPAPIDIVRAGGRISVIGVYSEPEMEFPLNLTFVKAIDLKFCGTANVVGRWDEALALITSGAADPASIISHRLPLDDAVRGYELFGNREAMKVVLTP